MTRKKGLRRKLQINLITSLGDVCYSENCISASESHEGNDKLIIHYDLTKLGSEKTTFFQK